MQLSDIQGQVEDSIEHPVDWQRARDAHIEEEKQRKRAYLRRDMILVLAYITCW